MKIPVHVMIIEDERVIALHLRKQLERLGYERTSAHANGRDALAAIASDPPDIILMDIRIDGDIDGIETAAQIPPDLMIPVIYLSAHSEDATLERAQRTRPYGFLIKPFSERELYATIQMALERRIAERALHETQQRLTLAMTAARMTCWEVDIGTRQMHSTGLGNLGSPQDTETITESWDDFLDRVTSEDRDMVRNAFTHAVQNGEFYDVVFRSHDGFGEKRWMRARGKTFATDKPGAQRIIGMMQDITDHRLTKDKLREAMAVYETTQDGVLILDPDLNVSNANKAFYSITRARPEDTLDRPPYFLKDSDCRTEILGTVQQHRHWHRDMESQDALGNPLALSTQVIGVEDENGGLSHLVAIVSDQTAIRQAEQELQYLAQYDGLTSLPNRLLATDRLNRALERCEAKDCLVACLFLDLDDFKNINDTLGHAVGDQVLLIAATRLKNITDRADTVARLGGDEFLIVREDVKNQEAAAALAMQLIDELQRPFYIVGHEMTLSASIGISLYPDHSAAPQDLIRLADTAMYAAKDRGRRTYAFYQSQMTETATRYMTRSLELRRGLENRELVLYYQPQVNTRTGELVGVEALLRWNHPTEGLLGPHEIIPVAEQSGIIVQIGSWVIREACAQARRWQDELGKTIRMAVNVSVRQIQDDGFVETVKQELAVSGIKPENLEIEVTESMIQNEDNVLRTLEELRDIGVSMAVDDFGTGYSCLRSIKNLPISRIKIDRAFVMGLPDKSDDAALIDAMLAMAKALGLEVTAEGVETQQQRVYLQTAGCQELQGFLFSRPVPADAIFADARPASGFRNKIS
ncbi:EAL domain-containing protein [Thalassospira sp. MA62]|nr:EAL domain-containing protein [Thalassospira sp. MA62]